MDGRHFFGRDHGDAVLGQVPPFLGQPLEQLRLPVVARRRRRHHEQRPLVVVGRRRANGLDGLAEARLVGEQRAAVAADDPGNALLLERGERVPDLARDVANGVFVVVVVALCVAVLVHAVVFAAQISVHRSRSRQRAQHALRDALAHDALALHGHVEVDVLGERQLPGARLGVFLGPGRDLDDSEGLRRERRVARNFKARRRSHGESQRRPVHVLQHRRARQSAARSRRAGGVESALRGQRVRRGIPAAGARRALGQARVAGAAGAREGRRQNGRHRRRGLRRGRVAARVDNVLVIVRKRQVDGRRHGCARAGAEARMSRE
mmetsp:Transcript_19160/g.65817  ORF Transcript_19160/g.65817 Transcript_19160/m.65817 type:complete len:322 (-) Transcript_19160:201-1166(-)